MLSEIEKFQAEVSAESNRLIKQGVSLWAAAMQAGKNVEQRRKLTKRPPDFAEACAYDEPCKQCIHPACANYKRQSR